MYIPDWKIKSIIRYYQKIIIDYLKIDKFTSSSTIIHARFIGINPPQAIYLH